MTSTQQRAELQRQIWQIANDVRGSVDGWDFKQYVLGTLFYRFISENFANYIEGGDESVNYAELSDDVITPAGVLAPKSKADFAFVLHCLSYLSPKGRAAIVCFPGIFYRSGAEAKIRKYLVDGNYVESVISLAPNLFFGTSISVNILVLSKHKTDNKTQFIDASNLYKKQTNNNVLLLHRINT